MGVAKGMRFVVVERRKNLACFPDSEKGTTNIVVIFLL